MGNARDVEAELVVYKKKIDGLMPQLNKLKVTIWLVKLIRLQSTTSAGFALVFFVLYICSFWVMFFCLDLGYLRCTKRPKRPGFPFFEQTDFYPFFKSLH